MNRNSYANISSFGNRTYQGGDDPLTFCLQETMDSKFQHGGIANIYGPRSQQCQAFMAERCAKKWDGFCEYAFREQRSNPNNLPQPNMIQQSWQNTSGLGQISLDTGGQLLQNAAQRKYCTFANCTPRSEPFDPTNPSGARITVYDNMDGRGCLPVCQADPATVDADPLMQRMLLNPVAAAPTLINICNTSRRNGVDLEGTQLGSLCKGYHANMAAQKQQR